MLDPLLMDTSAIVISGTVLQPARCVPPELCFDTVGWRVGRSCVPPELCVDTFGWRVGCTIPQYSLPDVRPRIVC